MSLLKIIDNPLQDVPMIAVLKSPIMGFTAEELSEIRLLNKEKYFYEIIIFHLKALFLQGIHWLLEAAGSDRDGYLLCRKGEETFRLSG